MDDTLRLPEEWREARYEGTGVALVHESESPTLDVVAGKHERTDGTERFEADATDFVSERTRLDARPDIPEGKRFGVIAGGRERSLFTVTPAFDDALAVAAWLAAVGTSERALRRVVGLHEGAAVPGFRAVVPDDDALDAALADEPENCVFSGKRTRSHELVLPYRYAPALADFPRGPLDAPRVPTATGHLVGAVSHTAWEDRGLDEVAFDAPLERVESGVYRFDSDVLNALDGAAFGRFTHRLPGAGPQG